MNENISFKSRIRFVDRNMFNKLKRGAEIRYRQGEANIIKDKNFFSEEIRTCTGCGLVNKQGEAEGFHLLDDVVNFNNLHDFLVYLFRFVKMRIEQCFLDLRNWGQDRIR